MNKNTISLTGLALSLLSPWTFAETVATGGNPAGTEIYQRGYLSQEQALESIELQEGYSLKLVLSDPDIKEPVAMAWDGNGVLYVVEMRTYMQDADATGEQKPTSRISRHEDVDGDGIYEKHSVFVDNLLLPRFVLPLDDRILVGITNTKDLWTYRDTDGDGVADEDVKVFEGGPRGGNMEHQASGMIWNIDNWLYCTYEPYRLRFVNGKMEKEVLPKGEGQWGLGKDNVGRIFYSRAGGERPAISFQQPMIYGPLELDPKLQEAPGFRNVYPIAAVPDVQGGLRRVGEHGGLNQFTGGGGQSIYRGDRLPEDLQGNLILPEPVGRLIRRAKVTREDGYSVVSNYYEEDEFVRSTDVNFRPLWSATSPDGAIMLIDMHRGIIQQGNWTRPGSYLRGVIDEWGLAENVGKGRIYRLEHTSYEPDVKPRMLDQSTSELVAHLSHPNGWWRDTAQKLIVLREDGASTIPALEKLAREGRSELGRLHALWTLEGLSAAKPELLLDALNDSSSIVRVAAVRISEPYLSRDHEVLAGAILGNSYLPKDIEMQLQVYNSIAYSATTQAKLVEFSAKLEKAKAEHPVFKRLAGMHREVATARAASAAMRARNKSFGEAMDRGKVAYEQLCFACHGADGKGVPMPGAAGQLLAPSFVGNPRVVGSDHTPIRTLLHGLTGDLDGKEYEGLMVGMGNNSDEWIADVVTYVRNSFGNEAPQTSPKTVAGLRSLHSKRTEPWTQSELEAIAPKPLSREGWKLTASHNQESLPEAIDGKGKTRYTTGVSQKKGMWVQVELPESTWLSGVKLDYGPSKNDGPEYYALYLSEDGKNWKKPVAVGKALQNKTDIFFAPQKARFAKIEITNATTRLYWSIHELELLGN
ncbi:DUF7133 domain-containing protein [Roseibacillus persicicus]|uniref:Protein containing Coagulation factor 5/8 type n=1 Tax=Roseibacillus persicicus TaxID=454148 RepID=A0A918TQ25_9BACT|nr:discoidin domain-containing protein [Roseibacillus persicicus]GHC57164.1 hypothetical protein GCM10007100_25070 [Roseibacillus persicicus]